MFGLLLQRGFVERSGFGRLLRSHPLSLRADPAKAKPEHSTRAWYHRVTFDAIPALRSCSVQEMVIMAAYVCALAAVIQSSLSDYAAVGRSGMYVLGHLASMHLALAILPVSRNSVFLWACRVPFDTAVRWHRRFGSMAVLFTFVHGATMLKIWNVAVLVYISDCQFGGAALFGTLSLVCLLGLLISSAEWVRRAHYEWFLYSHVVFVIGAYVFALLHSVQFRWLLIVPGALYCFDVLVRVFLSPYVVFGGAAALRPDDGADSALQCCVSPKIRLVRVQCLGSSAARDLHDRVVILSFRLAHSSLLPAFPAGSWIEICAPQVSRWQSHPYTVSSSRQDAHGTTITVHVRAMEPTSTEGGAATWSQQLWEQAVASLPKGVADVNFDLEPRAGIDQRGAFDEQEDPLPTAERRSLQPRSAAVAADASSVVLRTPLHVTLCGPYAGLYLPVMSYRVVVLIGGGIGITPLMARLEEYVRKLDELHAQGHGLADGAGKARPGAACRVPLRVYVLWSARSLSAFRSWFPSLMSRLSSRDCPASSRTHLQLHCTNPQVGLERLEREFDLVAEMPNSTREAINQAAAAIELPRNPSAEPPRPTRNVGSVVVQVESVPASRAVASAVRLSGPVVGPAHASVGSSLTGSPGAVQLRVLKAYDSQQALQMDDDLEVGNSNGAQAAGAADSVVPASSSVGASPAGPAVRRSLSSHASVRRLPQLHRARPNMVTFLDRVQRELPLIPPMDTGDAAADPASGAEVLPPLSCSDVFVLSCGPSSLISAAEAEAQRRGMHYAHEGFEW